MLSREEIMIRKEKKKKILMIAVLAVVGMFLILGIATLVLSGINNSIITQHMSDYDQDLMKSYVYPPADYNFNIFDDETYMGLDRNVWISDGAVRTVMSESNKANYAFELQFMYDVLNYIIEGDYTEYSKIFAEDCFDDASDATKRIFQKERFTMQQLFDIELEYLQTYEQANQSYTDIKVTYRINSNNGTFRPDLDFEDGSRPIVYTLAAERDGTFKVSRLLTYSMYLSGLY